MTSLPAKTFNILEDDPTTQLCMVENSFHKEKRENKYGPDIYTTPLIELNEPRIKMIPYKSCPKSLIKEFDSLQKLKDSLDKIKPEIIKKYNPYENIGNSIFMSRAAVKLANIDAIFHLTTNWGGNLLPLRTDHPMYFCDLAGGPGAFSQYLLWRVINSVSYGITLKTENTSLVWNERLLSDIRFHAETGQDGTGNLYNPDNWDAFYETVNKATGGAHIVVADGGFETKGVECARREFLTSRLITAECFLGVKLLRSGGHLVCKLYDTVTLYMQEMLYLMALAFEEISIFKPISSRPINAERYLVCKGKRDGTGKLIDYMFKILNQFSDEEYIDSFLSDKPPKDFIAWWTRQNYLSIKRQEYYTERLLNQIEGNRVPVIRFNPHKALILWDIPGNRDTMRASYYKKEDSSDDYSLLHIDYEERSPYRYDNVEDFLNSKESKNYPYKRLYYEDRDIVSMFKKLSTYKHDPIFYNKDKFTISNLNMREDKLVYYGSEDIGSQRVIVTKEDEYLLFNILSDMFNENARLQATVFNSKSNPYDCYFENIKGIATLALEKYKMITPYSLRETAYSKCKEVTSFRPNILTRIISLFKPKSMLDFSAGWGDRLIAAMAMGIEYTGVDPNSAVHKGYNAIIDFFDKVPELHIDRNKYRLIRAPFEDVPLDELPKVDLVMTSPPYFDLESYSKERTQSIVKYKTENAWFNRFLAPSLDKCIKVLNESGYLVININQKSRDESYISKMLEYMKSKEDMTYLGVLFYAKKIGRPPGSTFNNPQPIWVWRKGAPKIHLVPVVPQMRYEISNIVKDNEVMSTVGQGLAWSDDKLTRFLKYQNTPKCECYQKAVMIDGKVEGIVMIHTVTYAEGYFLTIFFNRRVIAKRKGEGKGFGTKTIRMAVADFANAHPHVDIIYADTLSSNTRAQAVLKKDFTFEGKVKIKVNGTEADYIRYSLIFPKDRGLTFLTAFEYLSDRVYKERLTERGWICLTKEETVNRCYADLLALGDKYEWDTKFFANVSANLKQHIDVDQLVNKVKLHIALQDRYYIAETIEVTADTVLPDNSPWIWRPEGERAGYGIYIVNSQAQLDKLKLEQTGRRAIISRYVTNPMLLEDGRKFHLRIFLVIMINSNDETSAIVFNEGRMGAGKKKFIVGDWDDPSVHITHMTDDYFRYPRDFPQPDLIDYVDDQINDILSDVVGTLESTFKKYRESKNAYKLLGCDFIVREDGEVLLLEINYKPGFRVLDKDNNEWISSVLANGIIDDVILPHFEGEEPKYEHTRPLELDYQ